MATQSEFEKILEKWVFYHPDNNVTLACILRLSSRNHGEYMLYPVDKKSGPIMIRCQDVELKENSFTHIYTKTVAPAGGPP